MVNQVIKSIINELAKNEIYGLESMDIVFFLVQYFNTESSNNFEDLVNFKNESPYFNFKIDSNLDKILFKIFTSLLPHQNSLKLSNNFVNIIFEYYLENENLSVIKDYVRYYSNKKLTEWIVNIGNPKLENETVLDGNLKINSFAESIANFNNLKNLNNLYGIQSNTQIKDIVSLDLFLKTNKKFNLNISDDDILFTDINLSNKFFDVIFMDLPIGFHNITHASCCQKIKKLKIRGTKSEPLFLQLIMMSLNKNGRAYIIVPDSLLYSDALISIDTRKYLIENFNIKKIIRISEDFYNVKQTKNSLIYFENNGKTSKIEISKLDLLNNEIVETKIMDLVLEGIKSNIYSLYYKNYIVDKKDEIKYDSFDNLFNINNPTQNKNELIIGLSKYYKNENSISLLTSESIDKLNNSTYITSKTGSRYMIYMLNKILLENYETYTKGKMNQFDISKLSNIKIPIFDQYKQQSICDYIEDSERMIQNNKDTIKYLSRMKECFINLMVSDNMVEINNICDIYENNDKPLELVGIIKNGLTAGSVYKLTSDKIQLLSNSYYIINKDSKYNIDYIYYVLYNNQMKLKEIANLTPQPNLTKNAILSFKIPLIESSKQKELVEYCKKIDNQIDILNSFDVKDVLKNLLNS